MSAWWLIPRQLCGDGRQTEPADRRFAPWFMAPWPSLEYSTGIQWEPKKTGLPSSKRLHNCRKSPVLVGKSTNFLWAMLNSELLVITRG